MSASADHSDRLSELLVKISQGDEAAFEMAYNQLAGPIYYLVRRILSKPAQGNPRQAEEVALEVLFEVWQTAGRFNPKRASGAQWVRAIAYRHALEERALRQRKPSENGDLRRPRVRTTK